MILKNYELFWESKTSEFVDKSTVIHNGYYSYNKAIYLNAKTNVIITCPSHGDFTQRPHNHLSGKGCSKCGVEKLRSIFTKSIEKFIEDSKLIHGDKYDYSKVNYINDSSKVVIVCPSHGTFNQSPNKHLLGRGCPSCGVSKSTETFMRKYSKIFPDKASALHNNRFDYSQSEYKSAKEKVKIICQKHGVFLQIPTNHLMGKGCPKCAQSHGERKIESYLTQNNINFETQKKFNDCVNINRLSFDFWIVDRNILIEFDGEQHYNPLGYQGGDKKLEYTIKCDRIKSDYCEKMGIKLVRISYLDIDKIDIILSKCLS